LASTSEPQSVEESQSIEDAAMHAGQKRPSQTQNKEVAMNDDELDHQSIETDDAEQIKQSSNLVSSPDITVSLHTYFTKLQLSFLLAAFKLLVDYNSGLKRYEVTPSRKGVVIALLKNLTSWIKSKNVDLKVT